MNLLAILRSIPAVFSIVVVALLSGCGGGGGGGGSGPGSGNATAYYANWYCIGSQCATVMGGYSGTTGPFASLTECEQWRQTYILTSSCSPTQEGGGTATPTISSFAPTSGAPGATVTITGTNFPAVVTVTINGLEATVVSVSSTQIVITIPSMAIFTGPITVNTSGGSVISNTNFSVTALSVTSSNLNAVACSTSLCVAVGNVGTILTSPTSVTWTSRTSGTDIILYGVAWSGTQFISVGASGTILTSPDGLTWTPRPSGIANALKGITCSNTQCAAVGSSIILTSPDGITWTSRPLTTGPVNLFLNAVTWSGTKFLAAGAGTVGGQPGIVFATSPDGVTWSPQVIASTATNDIFGVTWSGTQFVAVGGNSTSLGYIATSPDGIAWTPRTSGATMGFFGVASSGTRLLAVGYISSGTNNIFSSPDGVTWTAQISGLANPLFGVAWSGTRFVIVGGAGVTTTLP